MSYDTVSWVIDEDAEPATLNYDKSLRGYNFYYDEAFDGGLDGELAYHQFVATFYFNGVLYQERFRRSVDSLKTLFWSNPLNSEGERKTLGRTWQSNVYFGFYDGPTFWYYHYRHTVPVPRTKHIRFNRGNLYNAEIYQNVFTADAVTTEPVDVDYYNSYGEYLFTDQFIIE